MHSSIVQAGSARGDQGEPASTPPPVAALGIIGQVASRLPVIINNIWQTEMSRKALILIETTGLKKNLPFLGNRYFSVSN